MKHTHTHTDGGSSETIRKTPSHSFQKHEAMFLELHDLKKTCFFEPIYTSLLAETHKPVFTEAFDWSRVHGPQHVTRYCPHFLAWFVGFSEGDGSFIVSGNRLFFTITQKDGACLARLRTELGFGVICSDRRFPHIKRFTVTDRRWIGVLLHIFNGNLLLKKTTDRFALWVDAWNRVTGDTFVAHSRWDRFGNTEPPIQKREGSARARLGPGDVDLLRRESQVWQTSWLSGFLEAEGCFTAGLEKQSPVLRFLLDQTGELELLVHVQLLLGDYGSVWGRKDTMVLNQAGAPELQRHFRFETKHLGGLQAIVDYIGRHPLRTKKRVVFVQWRKLLNLWRLIREERLEHRKVDAPKRAERLARLVRAVRAWRKDTMVPPSPRGNGESD